MSGSSSQADSPELDSFEDWRLRAAREQDSEQLYHLFTSSRDDLSTALAGWNESQRDSFLRIQFKAQQDQYRQNHPNLIYEVVVRKDEIMGQLISASADKEIHILDISLFPGFRNRGIGTRLLREMLGQATRQKKNVNLQVQVNNPARHLYQRLGFIDMGGDAVFRHMTWQPSGDFEASPEN